MIETLFTAMVIGFEVIILLFILAAVVGILKLLVMLGKESFK